MEELVRSVSGVGQALLAVACAALIAGFALGFAAARAGAARARDAFKALAADALRDNTETFLALAGERLSRLEESSEADWDTRHKALGDTVAPLREALDRYRDEAHTLERERSRRAGELGSELRDLAAQTTRL